MKKTYQLPAICWLRVTDYMLGWLEHELGGGVRIGDKRVVSVQHLEGARGVLRMETTKDMEQRRSVEGALSATRWNCLGAAMRLNRETAKEMFGVAWEDMRLFVPIECPRMCLTEKGVLRPWTLDVCFGKEQARQLLRLLRGEFWKAVEAFDQAYARTTGGGHYPAKEMVETFCKATGTPEEHVDTIRREWMRQRKN